MCRGKISLRIAGESEGERKRKRAKSGDEREKESGKSILF